MDYQYKIKVLAIGMLILVIFIVPFYLFRTHMGDYGNYLMGLGAIVASLKYSLPYIILFLYGERYNNEQVWKKFLDLCISEKKDHILPIERIGGLIRYFSRRENALDMGNPWYQGLPYFADEIEIEFTNIKMYGKAQTKAFDEIKSLILQAGAIVSSHSTPSLNISEKQIYDELLRTFRSVVAKFNELNDLTPSVCFFVKKIIQENGFYKSSISDNQ